MSLRLALLVPLVLLAACSREAASPPAAPAAAPAEPAAAAETLLRVNAYAPVQGPRIPTRELRELVERDCFSALGARGPRLSSGVGVAA